MIIKTDKELRPRDSDDHYPTPDAFVQSAIDLVPNDIVIERIFDPGAGSGVFGTFARRRWPKAKIAGIETRDITKPAAYDSWLNLSFTGLDLPVQVDLVIGNPPYKYAEEAVRFGWQHLRPGGVMLYLLRLAFLEGQRRYHGLWREMPPEHVAVCSNRPSFTGEWVWVDIVTGTPLPPIDQFSLDSEPAFATRARAEKRFVSNGRTDATAYAFFRWIKPLDGAVPQTTMSFVLCEGDNVTE